MEPFSISFHGKPGIYRQANVARAQTLHRKSSADIRAKAEETSLKGKASQSEWVRHHKSITASRERSVCAILDHVISSFHVKTESND